MTKGRLTPTGFRAWIEEEKRILYFPTEQEYEEYIKEKKEDSE